MHWVYSYILQVLINLAIVVRTSNRITQNRLEVFFKLIVTFWNDKIFLSPIEPYLNSLFIYKRSFDLITFDSFGVACINPSSLSTGF